MQNRLLAQEIYEDIQKNTNISALLKAIRAISCQVETNILMYDDVDESKRRFYKIYQGEAETNATFLNNYKAVTDTLEYYKSNIYEDLGLIDFEIKEAEDKGKIISRDEARVIVKDKMQGLDIIKKADRKRYGELLTGIRDKFALGLNVYPTNLNKGYDLLESFASTHKIMPKRFGGGRQKPELSGMQYNQDGKKLVPGTDGRTKKAIWDAI